jgi:hypothetical protein
MFGFNLFGGHKPEDAHAAVYGGTHEGSFTHELLAGAAAFEAMRAYEKRREAEGEPVSHAFAKELLAGFIGAEIDKLIETKGLDYLDPEEAKRQAVAHAHGMYDERFGG